MNWVSITTDDLNDGKLAPLVNALRTSALGAGQTDPTPRIIQSVTNRIRDEIAGCKTNRVDQDTTKIPKGLHDLAVRMIVRQMMSRLQMALSNDEIEEQRNDLKYLERIARCDVPVDTPDNPTRPDVEVNSVVQVTNSTPRKTTRNTLKGL